MKNMLPIILGGFVGALVVGAVARVQPAQAATVQTQCESAVPLEAASLPDGLLLSVVATEAFQPQATAAFAAAAAPGDMRTVIVDGIVMTMPEEVISLFIKNGTFIVVYAGTTQEIPFEQRECWLRPDC